MHVSCQHTPLFKTLILLLKEKRKKITYVRGTSIIVSIKLITIKDTIYNNVSG